MAAVYSEEQTRLRRNVTNVSLEHIKGSSPENRADLASCDGDISVKNSSPAQDEARDHVQVAAVNAAVPQIRIKEEPVEEPDYMTVRVDDVGVGNWEQPGREADFSGSGECTDGDWPICCEEKSAAFGNKEGCTEHRREHTHDGPIVCLDTDSQWDNLLVSTDGGHQTLCCALCGCKFSNSREFFTHQLKHRNDIIKQESILETGEGLSKQKVFECNDCGKTYSSIGQCLNHQRSHKQASKSVFHQLAHLKKKSFQCPTCGRSYSRASALDAHRRCHEEKLFKSKNSEGEKYSADEVTVKAEDTADTSSEQLEESPKKLFECLDCGKSFRTMCGLGTHQRFSVNCSSTTVKVRVKRSFDCTECGKTFHRPMAMACHQRWHKRREQLHGNEQPFQCKECGKVFTSLTFYNKHQRLAHSQETPAKSFLHQVFQLQKKAFECQECGRRFSRASALQSHQLCHTDVFGDIMEGSSQKSSTEQTAESYEDEVSPFAEASVYSQNDILVKELRHDGTFSTKVYKADNNFKPIIIEESNSHRRDHGSQQNSDLELVCESDQEEKDFNSNLSKETVLSSPSSDPEMDVDVVEIDNVNINEGLGNTEMDQSPSQEAKKYECLECNRTFDKAVSLRCHMLWHSGGMGKKSRYRRKMHTANPIRKASIICEICGHESFTKASHYVHLGKHEDRKPYKSIMYQLANLQKNSFKCDVCNMQFSRLSALQSHQQHHNKRKKPYECSQCDKSYSNLSTLYNHQKVCSGKEALTANSSSDKDNKKEQFNPSKTLLGPKVHHCKKCGKGFWSMGAFYHHKQYHPQCGDINTSSSEAKLKSENGHVRRKRRGRKRMMMNSHNRKPGVMPDRVKSRLYKCDVCDKSYRVIGCFLKHKLIHQNQAAVKSFDDQVKQLQKNMYSCPDCGKNFSRAMALQFHMRSHGYETGLPVETNQSNKSDGPQCPICHAVFNCESSLEIHRKRCLKAKGERTETCREVESDKLGLNKDSKRVQYQTREDVKGTSEKVKHACDDFSAVGALHLRKKVHRKASSSMASQFECVNASPSKPEESTARALFYCTECGRKFSTNSALGTHRRWHKDKKLARFILKSSKMSRKNMENGPFLCNLCGKGFFYLCVLRRHQKYHPPIVARSDHEQKLQITDHLSSASKKSRLDCPDCDASFFSGSLLAAHFAFHHAKPPDAETKQHVSAQPVILLINPPNAPLADGGDKPKIKYHCLQCNKKFVNDRGLRAHKWQKHRRTRGRPPASTNEDFKPFPCSHCEKRYGSYGALQNHQRSCNANTGSLKQPHQPDAEEEQPLQHKPLESKCLFKCHKCGKAFPSEKQLDAHKEAAKSRPHCCALCCRGYWTESQLQQHLIWHDEVRQRLPTELRYRLNNSVVSGSSAKGLQVPSTNCVSPTKQPSIATNLKVGRNYKCHQCNKMFLSPHALEEHLTLHKGEEPYRCSLCPKTFTEIKDLIDHHQECLGDKELTAPSLPASSQDTESLTCIECGISFNQETDLHQHYIDHARGEF
ncbi:zinc finger protein 208 [Tachysurus fulvidraco]|uniref:zinc finger protein 208 n=1 Tax=Tachysurus fulvidraco TaxID=1234273 RepID=UPI001FEF73D8|nr:zinc finger protein 208 [Tachysurus fulvidraco]XP_047667261.1 zinc finger protein 208 [Tachysurus fulvidraco]XP_047667262.1 zinc finger protein 208 [Tachysurus fulvidraco]XP_047667263.1 zinc finger protein 208 [Tachysurus fulvidraco]